MSQTHLRYQMSRFSTRLPVNRLYTAAHFWVEEKEPGLHRVGFTKFATRMLGDLVETGVEVNGGQPVAVGAVVGWVEALKAATDLYCMVEGSFSRPNPELNDNPGWLQKDPYGKGWLYEVHGTPDPEAFDVNGYASLLDHTIKKMLGETT